MNNRQNPNAIFNWYINQSVGKSLQEKAALCAADNAAKARIMFEHCRNTMNFIKKITRQGDITFSLVIFEGIPQLLGGLRVDRPCQFNSA